MRNGWSAIAPAAAIFLAGFFAASAHATENPIQGGDGGGYFRVTCNGYVTGFDGRTGAYVDNFRLLCGAWDPAARRMQNMGPQQIQVGNSGGGGPSQASCPDGWAIKDMIVEFTFNDQGHAGFLHHIDFTCVSLATAETIIRTYGPTTPVYGGDFFLGGHLIPNIYKEGCAPGELMTGFQGRSGLYVDAVGMICGPVPSTPAPQTSSNAPVKLNPADIATSVIGGKGVSHLPGFGGTATPAQPAQPAQPTPLPQVATSATNDDGSSNRSAASGQALGFTGTWNSRTDKNWTYLITFIQEGQNVSGTYFVQQNSTNGRIKGTVRDRVLQFTWEQDGGFTGTGQFALAADGNSFTGVYQGDPHAGLDPNYRQGSWNGTRR